MVFYLSQSPTDALSPAMQGGYRRMQTLAINGPVIKVYDTGMKSEEKGLELELFSNPLDP